MILQGEGISLRFPVESDVERILQWENDVSNWLVSDTIKPYSHEEIQSFVEAGQDFFKDGQMRLMIETVDGGLAGCIDVFDFDQKNRRAGIGVLLDPNFRGKGIGVNALGITTTYCFSELEIHTLFADVLESNISSVLLFERCEFKKIGVREDWLWDGAQYHSQVMFQKVSIT